MQVDNNNETLTLGTSRSRHDASPGGRRNVLTTSPQEDEKRIDVATRATVLLLVRLLSLSFSQFLEAVSSDADRSFGKRAPWDSEGISSPARPIVAYETRRGVFFSLPPSLYESQTRDTRFSEWVEESLHPPPPSFGAVNSLSGRRDVRVCAKLVLCIVQNTRNNLWTGHDDWNIYSARYARCTLYDGIFVAAGVPATARSGITVPYFKHDPPRCLETEMIPLRAIAIVVCIWLCSDFCARLFCNFLSLLFLANFLTPLGPVS